MNRRHFLSSMLRAAAGAAILPMATTYARRWVASRGLAVPVEQVTDPETGLTLIFHRRTENLASNALDPAPRPVTWWWSCAILKASDVEAWVPPHLGI